MYGYGFGYNFARTSGVDVVVLTPDTIFSTDLYDWWDFTDNTTLTLSGSRIDAIDSKASGSTRQLTSSSSNRPQIVSNQVNGLQVANFDGVSEFMQVPSSTALYNFLHDQSNGGMVIIVFRDIGNTSTTFLIGTNNTSTSDVGFVNVLGSSGLYNNALLVEKGVIGSSNRVINNNTFVQVYNINKFNTYFSVVDPNNGTASDRSTLQLNFGTKYNNNALTNTPSTSNATYNLTICKNSGSNNNYLKGDIAEIIITTGQPTALQLTQTQTYLTNKYGTFPIT